MCALGVLAPWDRVPVGFTVVVPLLFEATVLWLRLGQGGANSGVGIVLLVPLVWTVLYHRRWESLVVIAGAVIVNLDVALLNKLPGDAVFRGAGFWALISVLVALAVHDLRDRMDHSLARQQELTRRAVTMNEAARSLGRILDVDAVVHRGVELASELASSPRAARRRAQFYRVVGDTARVVHEFDDEAFHVESIVIAEHPYLRGVVANLSPTYGALRPEEAGPSVRHLMQEARVVCGAWVPVMVDGCLDGILALTSRADDIGKDEFDQLLAVARLLELSLANARAHELLQIQATTDELTGLANRRGFDNLLQHRPGRQPFAILAVDVDGLKLLNDSHGHAAGDELLRSIGQALAGALRRGDTLARVGGDEFAVFCFDSDSAAAKAVADRMFAVLAEVSVAGLPARISIGAACGDATADAHEVQARADAAMYEAKRAGGMRLVAAPT
jgi:diguanylate cyclase (GGDEF)-like protein